MCPEMEASWIYTPEMRIMVAKKMLDVRAPNVVYIKLV
jgi:hypothetical protein